MGAQRSEGFSGAGKQGQCVWEQDEGAGQGRRRAGLTGSQGLLGNAGWDRGPGEERVVLRTSTRPCLQTGSLCV